MSLPYLPSNSHTMTSRQIMSVPKAAAVFGFTKEASLNAVHTRFRDPARDWHPDISQHDPGVSLDTFIRIKEAYDILVDYCMNYEISLGMKKSRRGVRITIQGNSG